MAPKRQRQINTPVIGPKAWLSTMGKRRMSSASASVFYPLPHPQIRRSAHPPFTIVLEIRQCYVPTEQNNIGARRTLYMRWLYIIVVRSKCCRGPGAGLVSKASFRSTYRPSYWYRMDSAEISPILARVSSRSYRLAANLARFSVCRVVDLHTTSSCCCALCHRKPAEPLHCFSSRNPVTMRDTN